MYLRYAMMIDQLKTNMDAKAKWLWPKSLHLLGWLVGAVRPLTWHEMQAILSFEPEERKMDLDLNMLRNNVTEMLGGLVHVREKYFIRLVHETARE
jgi:hypothetical protein